MVCAAEPESQRFFKESEFLSLPCCCTVGVAVLKHRYLVLQPLFKKERNVFWDLLFIQAIKNMHEE
jgi:hypothetical protein